MVRASYDTEAIRAGATRLDDAASSLKSVGNLLSSLGPGACPHAVESALESLSKRGKDMVTDIQDEAATLGEGMRNAATSYDDLDKAIARGFGSGS